MSQHIRSRFNVYPSDSDYYKLRHLKRFRHATVSGSSRPKEFKQSLASIRTSKSNQIVKIQDVEYFSSKSFSLLARALYKSFKTIKKTVFQSSSFDHPLRTTIFALKKIFKNVSQLETLSMVSLDASNIKYSRCLKNVKLSIPETPKVPSSAFSKVRHLQKLERVELCISDEDQALTMLKEVQHQIKAKYCCLDITLMKAFWPCMDNIESLSHQTFKKVASVELNLSKLAPAPLAVDQDTLEAHLKFLRFLYEPAGRSRRRRRLFECIKFPGMKLQIDPKEYDSPPKIYSLLESFLSVYDSSVLHVKEYSPEKNFAKLYFELTSWASSWEILELLKDIIEIKDIRYLNLELDVKGMTEAEFRNIIEKICTIEKLEFLYVASGSFSIEVKQPAENYVAGSIRSEQRGIIELQC